MSRWTFMNRTLIILGTLTAAVALFLSPGAGAQLATVETTLETTVEQPLGEGVLWDGGSASGRVNVALCYAEGGVNPAGGEFLLTATVSKPDWMNAEVTPMEVAITPPTGPTTEPGCDPPTTFTVSVNAPGDLQYGTDAQISVTIAVTEATEENTGVGMAGTYAAPSGTSGSLALRTIAPPMENGQENDGGAPQSTDPSTAESPAPGAAFVVLALFAMALLRVRRGGS